MTWAIDFTKQGVAKMRQDPSFAALQQMRISTSAFIALIVVNWMGGAGVERV
jgi:hypothetical protein